MTARRIALLALIALTVLGTSGCLMRRTIKEDGAVVAQGYVIKPPPLDLAPPE